MDTSKIIKGVVSNGRYTVTAPIVKEDYGLYLQIEGVELPSTYEVDFSNSENSGTSVTMIGNADGVLIPRQFIDSGKDVFAFLYHVGSDFGRTVYKFRIPNKVRPGRTNEEPTPEEQSVIDQTISALNDAVADAQDAQEAIENMSVSAQTLAEGSSATVTKTESEGVVHLEFGIPKGQTGDTPTITASKTGKTTSIYVDGSEVAQIEDGTDGTNGDDGYSPTASVSKTGKTATITITDKNGTTSAQVEDGTDGEDGISPTVTITPITGGHRITITDADGEHSADVMDGTGNVGDVQINGTSIVSDGVANVPIGLNKAGAVLVSSNPEYGISINSNTGIITVASANDAEIKAGTLGKKPIAPQKQHMSTFYGLAKSAGDATQSSSNNAVGVYTKDAKSKIKKMIGANDEFELIRCVTLEEDMAKVTIDTDDSSSPFEISDFIVFIWSVGASGATSEASGKVSLNSTNLDINRCSEIGSLIRKEGINTSRSGYVFGINAKKLCYFTFSSATINQQIVDGSGNISEFGEANIANKSHGFVGVGTVNTVAVGTTSGGKFGTGSIIALYGIRV